MLPFSVIPGGVQSGDDLRVALQNDLLAAKHYAIFNVSSSHVVRRRATVARMFPTGWATGFTGLRIR